MCNLRILVGVVILFMGGPPSITAIPLSSEHHLVCAITAQRLATQSPPALVLQHGHDATINSLAFSADGETLASGGDDNVIKLWDMTTHLLKRSLPALPLPVRALVFVPHTTILVSAAAIEDHHNSGVIRCRLDLWDTSTGISHTLFNKNRYLINAVACSSDGNFLATTGGSYDDSNIEFMIWDIHKEKLVRTIKLGDERGWMVADSVALSPNGTLLAGTASTGVYLWHLSDSAKPFGLPERKGPLAFSSDSVLWGSSGSIWAPLSVRVSRWSVRDDLQGINHIAIDPNKGMQVEDLENGVCRIQDMGTGTVKHTFDCGRQSIEALSMSPEASVVVVAIVKSTANDNENPDNSVVFDRQIQVRESTTGKLLWSFHQGSTWASTNLLFEPGGQTLIQSISNNRDIPALKYWNLLQGRLQGSPLLSPRIVGKRALITLSPDGRLIALNPNTKVIYLLSTQTGKLLHVLKGEHECEWQAPHQSAFSGDGTLFSASDGFWVKIWNTRTGKLLKTLPTNVNADAILCVALSHDGKLVATGDRGAGVVRVWDTIRGRRWLGPLEIPGGAYKVLSLAFSPDSSRLAAGLIDSPVAIWNLKTGHMLKQARDENYPVYVVDFSPDSKYIASGTKNGLVQLFSARSGAFVSTIAASEESIYSLAFSCDSRRLASADQSGAIKLWPLQLAVYGHTALRDALATLIPFGNNDYLAITAGGYYAISRTGYNDAAFRVNNVAYPFNQFDLRLNRPDVVLKRLGSQDTTLITAYYRAYLKRLDIMHLTTAMLGNNILVPQIKIVSPSLPFSTSQRHFCFMVQASANAPSECLDRINVFINGVPVNAIMNSTPFSGMGGFNLRPHETQAFEGNVNVELSSGSNLIEVSATNRQGVESIRRPFTIVYDGPKPKPKVYIAAIGVSTYLFKEDKLTYPCKDARSFAKLFGHNVEGSGADYVLLTNKDATKSNIINLVSKLAARTGVDDEIIFFLAGHGTLDPDPKRPDYYFGTYDINFKKPTDKGLSYNELEGLLDGIPARKRLILLDTCYSGEVNKEAVIILPARKTLTKLVGYPKRNNGGVVFRVITDKNYIQQSKAFQDMQELYSDLRRGPGCVVISACGGLAYAQETNALKHGAFSYATLSILKRPKTSVTDLRNYVIDEVPKLTYDPLYKSSKQQPTMRRENLLFDWYVQTAQSIER